MYVLNIGYKHNYNKQNPINKNIIIDFVKVIIVILTSGKMETYLV